MGTIVNSPIPVDRAVQNFPEAGMAAIEAVSEAVEICLRPTAMSTITALFGLASFVFLPGAGTKLYRGVDLIVMSGFSGLPSSH